MHSHDGVHGDGALGSQRCGSRFSTYDMVAAQRAMAIASKTYDDDVAQERERWEECWIGLATACLELDGAM